MDTNTSGSNNTSFSQNNQVLHPQELLNDAIAKLNEIQNPLSDFEYLRITDTTSIPQPVPRITINKEIISTEGNITTISGASKSGKSAFSGILIAGAISDNGVVNGLEGVLVEPNLHKRAVLHFDTEQSKYKHQINLLAVLRRSGIETCPEYYQSYNIRELDLKQYQETTSKICAAANKQFKGIHLILIDGGADFISDVNDPTQSNALVKYFEDLAIKYSTPIIVVVHTNPGSDKERGHLGSQFQRKSESVLMIKTEGDISYLEPKFLRMAGKGNIPLIQFMYDSNKGYHVGFGIRSDEKTNKDLDRVSEIQKICIKAFSGQVSYKYADAINAIMKESNKKIITAKGMFSEMRAHDMIVQGEDKNWRINGKYGTNHHTGTVVPFIPVH